MAERRIFELFHVDTRWLSPAGGCKTLRYLESATVSHQSGIPDMARPIVIAVVLEDCKDGWLRVRSDDLPNLILSGPDREEVVGCIAPAIATIFEHYGHSVTVRESQSAHSLLSGPNPRTVDMHVQHRFVVEVAEAA